jgi:FAD/FMN-containing dehydrogenase
MSAAEQEQRYEVRSWDGSFVTYPRATAEAHSIDEVVAIMRDRGRYPSPVRARGSGHSPANCGEADGGTIVDMRRMNRILHVGADTITAEGGALYIDIAQELERHGLQVHVNTEIGCLTIGSGACCATKDASMPGELGQISSYVVGMKIVTPAGDILEVGEDDPGLLQAARSSYGLFGIVCEVTLRACPLRQLSVQHRTFRVAQFADLLPELIASNASLMFYLYPFLDRVSVEFRQYVGDARAPGAERPNRTTWKLRNFTWRTVAPAVARFAEACIPWRAGRYVLLNWFDTTLHVSVDRLLRSPVTLPPDQMIRYPDKAGWTGFTSSIWAFPEPVFGRALNDYCQFVRRYDRDRRWRPNMLAVGYRVAQDTSSLLSYTYDGPVLTIDPVCTGTKGWVEFLDAFNVFCSERGGSPLLNQTRGVTPEMARRAFGERLATLEGYRRRFDPEGRVLNDFFRVLLPVADPEAVTEVGPPPDPGG